MLREEALEELLAADDDEVEMLESDSDSESGSDELLESELDEDDSEAEGLCEWDDSRGGEACKVRKAVAEVCPAVDRDLCLLWTGDVVWLFSIIDKGPLGGSGDSGS